MKSLLSNWRTSLVALLGLIAVGLYWGNVISSEELTAGVAVLTAAGLFNAKDANSH